MDLVIVPLQLLGPLTPVLGDAVHRVLEAALEALVEPLDIDANRVVNTADLGADGVKLVLVPLICGDFTVKKTVKLHDHLRYRIEDDRCDVVPLVGVDSEDGVCALVELGDR